MPVRVEAKICDGYMLVEHSGDMTPAEMVAARRDVMPLMQEHGIANVLVDVRRVTNQPSVGDTYAAVEEHAGERTVRPRAAVVGREDQAEDLQFIENVGVNRGMSLRSFTSFDDAIAWLGRTADAGQVQGTAAPASGN